MAKIGTNEQETVGEKPTCWCGYPPSTPVEDPYPPHHKPGFHRGFYQPGERRITPVSHRVYIADDLGILRLAAEE